MTKPHSMRDPFPPAVGMNSPSVIVPHQSAGGQGTNGPTSRATSACECVGDLPHTGAALDACIRRLDSLTREEVTALAIAAADNGTPLPRALPFEPGTERAAWFMAAFWRRDWELRAVEA